MGEVGTIGLDLAKWVFQARGAEASGTVVFRKKLRREQMPPFFAVLDVEIRKRAKTNALAKPLMTIPGVGAVLATAMVAQAPAPETRASL